MKYRRALILAIPAAIVTVAVFALASAGAANAPANDNKANAQQFSTLPFAAMVDTTGATTETNEALNCSMQATIWYRFTSPVSGKISVNLNGSDFDTGIAVYTTSGDEILCNDDYYGLQSHVTFQAQSGTAYYIQLGGYNGHTGNMSIAIDLSSHFPEIIGTVTEAGTGTPVAHACVRLYKNQNSMGFTYADNNGEYDLDGLVPDSYKLYISDCGAYTRAPTWFPNALVRADGEDIPVGEADHLTRDVQLPVGGTLSGHVTDQTSHLPIEGMCVSSYDPDGTYVSGTTTDANGSYTLKQLNSDYTVYFRDCNSPQAYVAEYLPGVLDQSDGQVVHVGAGEAVLDTDIALPRGATISGHILNAAGNHPLYNACVGAYLKTDTGNKYITNAYTDGHGAYTLGGLPPGGYLVWVYSCSVPHWFGTRYLGGTSDASTATVINVTAGQTVPGQDVNMTVFSVFGDGNCDGQANVADAIPILANDAEVSPPSACLENADLNCDGGADDADVMLYLNWGAGLPTPPPTGNCPAPGPFPATPTPAP